MYKLMKLCTMDDAPHAQTEGAATEYQASSMCATRFCQLLEKAAEMTLESVGFLTPKRPDSLLDLKFL